MLVGFVILHDPCPKIFPQNAINPKPHGLRLVLVPHITWARSGALFAPRNSRLHHTGIPKGTKLVNTSEVGALMTACAWMVAARLKLRIRFHASLQLFLLQFCYLVAGTMNYKGATQYVFWRTGEIRHSQAEGV